MKSAGLLCAVTLGASAGLIASAGIIAWRSAERLYIAYLFVHGRYPTDDLITAHINLRLELSAWAIVLGIVGAVLFLLRNCYRSKRQALSIVSLLLAHLVLGQVSSGPAAQGPLHNSTNGTIVLGGGYLDDEGISALLRRAIGLAAGAETSMVIIPTADPRLQPTMRSGSHMLLVDYEREARVKFATLGVNHVTVLHTRDRAVANSDKFAMPLRNANCVWIPGGDPELLFEIYPNTTVQKQLQRILDRGGVIVGDSAGAEIIGQGLLAVHPENPKEMPTVQEGGLRLLKNTFVMTHVNRYKAGIVEQGCNTFVCAHPEMLTLLIGENTAVMIQHDQITRLLGSGRTGIIGGSNHASPSPIWLSGSARYDLRRRILVQ